MKDTHSLKVKGWKKIFHANSRKKVADVAIDISDNIGFKHGYSKRQRRTLHNDKRSSPPREYHPCKHLCTQHRTSKYIKQILINIKGETDSNTVIVRDFNTSLTSMNE